MPRKIFEPDHELFRESARKFIDTEIVPNVSKWEESGQVDKEMFRKAGEAGLRMQNKASIPGRQVMNSSDEQVHKL